MGHDPDGPHKRLVSQMKTRQGGLTPHPAAFLCFTPLQPNGKYAFALP